MSTTLPSIAFPGLALGPTSKYTPGPGTHIQAAQICASLSGAPSLDSSTKPPTISIPRLLPPSTSSNVPSSNVSNRNTLPRVGSIVLGKVTRCMIRQVNVAILVVDDQVCADEWSGVVRREDVRATEKEKVVIGEGFRVGDLIRGEVISLGDQTNYYLTTARNELGVIMAKSEAGNTMYPISWKEFKDPMTGETESRKVAKPF
ncbi:exosome complex component csl4 [Physcia stellaris]|nr:exosome complex component csl4 [Physcia stellaris]